MKGNKKEVIVSKITIVDEEGQPVGNVGVTKLTAIAEVNSKIEYERLFLCMAMHDIYTGECNYLGRTEFEVQKGQNTLTASIDMEQLSDYNAYTKELRVYLLDKNLEYISDCVKVESIQIKDVDFDCYISEKTKLVKGIVLIHRHGYGNSLKGLETLKVFCSEHDFAIISFIDSKNGPLKYFLDCDLCGNTILLNIDRFAETTGHSELQYAPIITFGHSNATSFAAKFAEWKPDRCFGVIAYKSARRSQIDRSKIVEANIPMLIITGELDEAWGYEGQIECAEDMVSQGGAYIYIQDPGSGHGPNGNKSDAMLFAFIDIAYSAKVPEFTEYNGQPISLKRMDMEKGLYGFGSYTKDEKGRYKYVDYKYISHEEYFRRKTENESFVAQSWLFDEGFAKKWVEFCSKGVLNDKS